MLDVPALRSQFPALASDAAFFDGPGGSQVPQSVIDAIAGYLRDSNANLGGAFATSQAADEVMGRARAGGRGLHGRRAGGHRVRGEHDDAQLPARTCRGAHDVAGGRDRRDGARPRRERLTLARGGRRSRPRRAHRPAAGRGHDSRHRCPRGADRRAHPSGRLHAGLERGRVDPGRRPHRGGRSRRRRARLGGRGAHGAAPAAARTRARARRRALLAVQVLRAAPGDRGDPARSRRVAAGGPGAAIRGGSARTPLRDGHAVARGDRGGARRDRVPARARRRRPRRWVSP